MATSIIKLHVFSGNYESDPPCYLLKIDNFHCLLDCGWDSNFSDRYVEEVTKYSKLINAIFLTHSDIWHLGALPYILNKCGVSESCPIFATFPVARLGHLSIYDAILNKTTDGCPQKFSLDDIDNAFERIIPLKYQQTRALRGKGSGISVTPYLSGHSLGGAMWRIRKEDTDILYVTDFNHKKELHLNGATFDLFPRPQLLIMGCYTGGVEKHSSQKTGREDNIKNLVLSTLRKDGSILFLSDTAGRCLELAYLLENLWHNQQSGLMAYGLVLFNMVGSNIIESCQSFVEWMSEKVMQSFEEHRNKPFEFKYMRICHTLEDLNEIADPKIIIGSQSHLNYGLTQELMLDLSNNPRNLIVLTERPRELCVASQLYRKIDKKIKITSGGGGREPIDLMIPDYKIVETTEMIENSVYNIVEELEDERAHLDMEDEFNDMSSSSNSSSDSDDLDLSPQKKRRLSTKDVDESKKNTHKNSESKQEGNTSKLKKDGTVDTWNSVGNEVRGVHLSGFDVVPYRHHHHHGISKTRKQMTYPLSRHTIFWDDYGIPINNSDPNYLNTFGSSYAMKLLNNELMLQGNLNPLSVVNSDARLILSQQSINKISDKINRLIGANTMGTPTKANNEVSSLALSSNNSTNGHQTIPTKKVTLKCGVMYLEFEGLADNLAHRQVISRLKPQELVLINRDSTHDYNMSLVPFCTHGFDQNKPGHMTIDKEFVLSPSAIHLPTRRNEPINLTKELHLFQARMSDSLVSGLQFQKMGVYELAWVDSVMRVPGAQLSIQAAGDNAKIEPDKQDDEDLPILEPPIINSNNNELVTPSHDTLYINEPKLSDLKQTLIVHGHQAEFMGGMLIVDKCVAVKRSETGKFTLEGALSQTYFSVRQVLYRQFAIL